jgi:hypothetical protein
MKLVREPEAEPRAESVVTTYDYGNLTCTGPGKNCVVSLSS